MGIKIKLILINKPNLTVTTCLQSKANLTVYHRVDLMLPGKIYNLKSTFFYFSLSILSAWNCKLPKLPQTQKSKLCFHHNTRAWGFSRFSKAQQNQNEKSFYKCLETFIQSMNPNLSGFGAEAALRAVQIADNVSLTMGLILKKKNLFEDTTFSGALSLQSKKV